MARDRRLSLVSGVSPRTGETTASGGVAGPSSRDSLVATGDGVWIHDTHTDPAPESATSTKNRVPKALLVERNDRILELESELEDAKREIESLRLASLAEDSDELTLPRAAPRTAVSTPKLMPVDLIPRLPPRPAPPPAGFAARGTLQMAPSVTELPLPPPKPDPIPSIAIAPLPPEDSLGAFPLESAPSSVALPAASAQPIWLFVMLAVASFALAVTGYAFIARVGPFAVKGSPEAPASAPDTEKKSVARTASTLPTSAATSSVAPVSRASESTAPSASSSLLLQAPAVVTTAIPTSNVSALPSTVAPADPVVSPPPPDLAAPLSYQGYLTVHAPSAHDVVVQGIAAGSTNQPLLVRCGPKNVRLRDGAIWVTEGQHVHIDCMKLTEVSIAPSVGR